LISYGVGYASEIQIVKNQYVRNARFACYGLSHVPSRWPYYQLATLSRVDGHTATAQEYLRLSGYADVEKPITLTTPFAEDLATGHTFAPKRIAEVVPGKVYTLSGYDRGVGR
jgi:hypothetical protein